MTILLVGVCVNGMVRKNGSWTDPRNGQKQWGITGPAPCEKCGGKGCPRETAEAEPDAAAS